jgi:hypothetical protein
MKNCEGGRRYRSNGFSRQLLTDFPLSTTGSISAVERAGFSTLNEGQVVQYEEVSNRGRMAAESLRVSR